MLTLKIFDVITDKRETAREELKTLQMQWIMQQSSKEDS
jgi:hypothetical protein